MSLERSFRPIAHHRLQARQVFHVHAVLVVLVSFALLAFHTGDASLWNIDEANNAEALKLMILHHNYVVPFFNGYIRAAKPILNYWLMDLGVRVLGLNGWGLRIGSVLMGTFTIAYLMWSLRDIIGARAALLTGLFTATALHSQIIFRAAVPDPLLIFFVTVSLLSWLRGYLKPHYRTRNYLVSYVAMGCGTLTEGPIAFLLPGLIITVFLLSRNELPHLWRQGRLSVGIPLFLMITLPWYLAVGLSTHWVWDEQFFEKQNVFRYIHVMQGHNGPLFYYIFSTILGLLPWSIFLPQTVLWALKHWRLIYRDRPISAYLWYWAILWIGFFSLGATKLPNYVWEAYPPLLALIAMRMDLAWNGKEPFSRGEIWFSAGFLGVVGVILVGLGAWLVPAKIPPLGSVAYLGLPYLFGACCVVFALRLPSMNYLIAGLSASAVGLTFCLMLLTVPALDALKPTRAMGHLIRSEEHHLPYELATWRWWEPSFLFYAGRGTMRVHEIHSPKRQITAILRRYRGPLFIVLPREDLSTLRAMAAPRWVIRTQMEAYELYHRIRVVLVRIIPRGVGAGSH